MAVLLVSRRKSFDAIMTAGEKNLEGAKMRPGEEIDDFGDGIDD